ncbi:MAG: hypothetical protein ACU85U_10345 [Gammaproteobacteria bacterium]|jgi:hypothetical protein
MAEQVRRAIIRWAITACGLAPLLSGCGGTETDFETVVSPTGEFRLVVTVTVPALPHARHTVTAYLERETPDGREKLIDAKLANDGVPFTDRNIGIRWTGLTTALICLRPTDLADRGIRVDVSGKPTAEIKPGC